MDRNTIEKKFKRKKVSGNSNLNISAANTDRPIASCPETQYDVRANKTTSRNKSNNGNLYQQVEEHRLQNAKNLILGHLNVNSLRNKTEAVEELMENNIDIFLFSETKLDQVFGSRWMSIERKSIWIVRVINEYYAHCFSLR